MTTSPGLTLVELLIGMTILAFVSLMVGSVYLAHFRLFSNQSTNIEVSNKSRIALDEMVNQIKEGSAVSTSSIAGCTAQKTTATDSIVVKLWPLDPTNSEPYDPGDNPDSYFDLVLYCQDSNNYLHKVTVPTNQGLGSKRTSLDKILSTNVSQITLTYCCDGSGGTIAMPGGDTAQISQVQIRLVVSSANFDKRQTYSTDQTATAVLRNK